MTDLQAIQGRIRDPVAIILGSPRQAANLLEELKLADAVCYQMDIYQAGRLRDEISRRGLSASVSVSADLWDLAADFQTAIYPPSEGGERGLKIDMVEQSFHILRPKGLLVILSPYENDQLFPPLLKKVFGRVHTPSAGRGQVFQAYREGDRPRRRHEMVFHARIGGGESLRFLSRPGVFSYGRLDEGARALLETVSIEAGERVLDMGCGCGTNGIFAGLRAGSTGRVTFVDSNLRAVALAEHNAQLNGLADFQVLASADGSKLAAASFDVALANPPYYAHMRIAELFIDQCCRLLRPGGRFYLVTRQAEKIEPLIAERFASTEVSLRRGYAVFCAR